jgi:TRAP-type uncharacterized transport system substrate-binding protein
VAVYISFDDTPLAIITRADAATRKPADLDGKKITGGPGTAVPPIAPVFVTRVI